MNIFYLMCSSDSMCHGISVSYCDNLVNFSSFGGNKQIRFYTQIIFQNLKNVKADIKSTAQYLPHSFLIEIRFVN